MSKFNFLRPILVILLIFIPLYPKFPLVGITGTYVAIRLDDIVVALSFLAWIVFQVKNRFPVFKEKITYLFIAYFIAITLSFINAALVFQTDALQILALNLLRRFEYISLFFITLSAIKSTTSLKFVYLSTFITSAGVAIYGLGQRYFRFPVISTMNEEFSKGQLLQMDNWTRISSTFAGHYDLAAYLSVLLIIIGAITIFQKNKLIKIISLAIWLVLFYILTLTASRVSTFAYIGGFILVLILIKKFLWIIPVSLLFVLSIVSSKDLNQRLLATIPALKNQFVTSSVTPVPTALPTPTIAPVAKPTVPVIAKTTPTVPTPTIIRHQPEEEFPPVDTDVGVARSGEIRFNAEWPRAITAFQKNILLGTGLGSITLATDNDYLRLLGESGLLGFLTFMAIPIYFTIRTIKVFFKTKSSTNRTLILVLFGGMITAFTNATLIDIFEASKTAYLFWVMMGVYYHILNFSKNAKNN